MATKIIKSILCGMLFFGSYLAAVGITTEPDYAFDDDGQGYDITFIGYTYSVVRPCYIVELRSSGKIYKGKIPWDFKKSYLDPFKIKFFDEADPTKPLELNLHKPFPCRKARDFIGPEEKLLIDLDDFHEPPPLVPYVFDEID